MRIENVTPAASKNKLKMNQRISLVLYRAIEYKGGRKYTSMQIEKDPMRFKTFLTFSETKHIVLLSRKAHNPPKIVAILLWRFTKNISFSECAII